jgi:uncharacterized protein (DUF433 family)
MDQIITINPEIRNGEPIIRGMRITVYDILKMLSCGMNHEEILEDYPELTNNDIIACLKFAADKERINITLMKSV